MVSKVCGDGVWRWGGHLGLKGTVTLSLSSRGVRLNTSHFTTKTGCSVHTNKPIIGGFYCSVPPRFNLPNKHSLFPCVRGFVSHMHALHRTQPLAPPPDLISPALLVLFRSVSSSFVFHPHLLAPLSRNPRQSKTPLAPGVHDPPEMVCKTGSN